MRLRQFFFILLFLSLGGAAQTDVFKVYADSLPVYLKKSWKFNTTDNAAFASINYNDSTWSITRSAIPVEDADSIGFKGFAWFRIHLSLPTQLVNKPLVLDMQHLGASEIYIDGVLTAHYGKVSFNGTGEERFDPTGTMLSVIFRDSTEHLIAVRYCNHKFKEYELWDDFYAGFFLQLDTDQNQTFANNANLFKINIVLLSVAGFLFALTFIHLSFFIFYRKQKHHLYYSIFTFFFALFFFLPYISLNGNDPDITEPVSFLMPMVVPVYFISLAGFTHYLILGKAPRTLWLSVLLGLIIFVGFFYKTGYNHYFYIILIFLVIHQTFRALVKGLKQQVPGVKIIYRGFMIFVLFVTFLGINVLLMALGIRIHFNVNQDTIYFLLPGILSIPVSISLYMARNFATLNVDLEKKLAEVEELSAKSIEQEKEKQQMLSDQNILLEQKVKERTAEVVAQKELLEEKQKEILDSIRYAKRIQTSLLPTEKLIARIFKALKGEKSS